MLTKNEQISKRTFDLIFSFFGFILLFFPLVFLIILSSLVFKKFGLYRQSRVGQSAELFTIYKIRTMKDLDFSRDSKFSQLDTYGITLKGDKRLTSFGNFLRKFKLDELPQLYNVLIGDMSLVGPRPDIEGFADKLEGENRIILAVRPGITGPATLTFRNEELLLSEQEDPLKYNNEIIWPQKIELNKLYVENWSFKKDIKFILQTFFN